MFVNTRQLALAVLRGLPGGIMAVLAVAELHVFIPLNEVVTVGGLLVGDGRGRAAPTVAAVGGHHGGGGRRVVVAFWLLL